MLRLTATDQSITMTTSASGSVDYISDWTDIVNATAVTTAGSGQGNVTTATTTTIIAAPASGSSRAVRSAMISNRHGSTSNTIQLFKTVGAASYAISKPLVLLAGETVRFSDEGFCFVGNACELEVTSATTAERLESNATTGVMQIVGPAAGTTRVVTIPDANATMARTDSAQTFSGVQTFAGRAIFSDTTASTTQTTGAVTVAGGVGILGALNSGPFTITGTTATDGPTYSAELLSGSGWTSTDWTGDFATGFTHSTGNTTALTNTLAAVIGNKYQIALTITGRTAGSVVVAFGGQSSAAISATSGFGPTATTTGTLSITPTTDFNGKVVVSVKQITGVSASPFIIYNSAGSPKFVVRISAYVENTLMGASAGTYLTSGTYNSFYGYLCGANCTTGHSNTLIGYQAARYLTTGYYNTVIGMNAMISGAITGNGNSCVGQESLYALTTGVSNSSVGRLNLAELTTGSSNSALGTSSGRGITTGSNNTILGAGVGGLSAGLTDNIILATGQGTIRMQFDGAKWKLNLAEVPAYANNAAAIAGGLAAGNIYRTNGDPDALCIVH